MNGACEPTSLIERIRQQQREAARSREMVAAIPRYGRGRGGGEICRAAREAIVEAVWRRLVWLWRGSGRPAEHWHLETDPDRRLDRIREVLLDDPPPGWFWLSELEPAAVGLAGHPAATGLRLARPRPVQIQPGTEAKLRELAARAASGEELFDREDL